MSILIIVAIVFAAAFLQSLAGFGFAVMIMPLFTLAFGLQVAAPTVALIALTVYGINVLRFRQALNIGEVARLGAASVLGVPAGIWILSNVDETLVTRTLGVLLIGFAVYTLVRPATSWVPSRLWVYPAGFLAGCLGGAYNAPGPPAIVYGSLRQWPRDEFRAAMQTLFLISGVLVAGSHLATGHLTNEVLTYYLYALPALGLGVLAASLVDHKLDRDHFRTIVTMMILVLGLSLALSQGKH